VLLAVIWANTISSNIAIIVYAYHINVGSTLTKKTHVNSTGWIWPNHMCVFTCGHMWAYVFNIEITCESHAKQAHMCAYTSGYMWNMSARVILMFKSCVHMCPPGRFGRITCAVHVFFFVRGMLTQTQLRNNHITSNELCIAFIHQQLVIESTIYVWSLFWVHDNIERDVIRAISRSLT